MVGTAVLTRIDHAVARSVEKIRNVLGAGRIGGDNVQDFSGFHSFPKLRFAARPHLRP